MKAIPSSFDAVFDGKTNFAPRAIFDLNRAGVPNLKDLLQKHAVHGEDGLDEYDAVPMVLHTDTGQSRKFVLWRHAHNPEGQLAIQLPIDEEFQDTLMGILQTLRIPAAALVWLDASVAAGRRDALPTGASALQRRRTTRPVSRGEFGRWYVRMLTKFHRAPDDAVIDDEYSSYRTITEFLGVAGDIGMMEDPPGHMRIVVTPRFLPPADRSPRQTGR